MKYFQHSTVRVAGFALTTWVSIATGCSGSIGGPGGPSGRDVGPGEDDDDGAAPDDDAEGGTGGTSSACAAEAVVAPPARLRRLTRREYENTVKALLDVPTVSVQDFVDDEFLGGFSANGVAPVDSLQVRTYEESATSLARAAVAQLDTVLSCAATDAACIRDALPRFTERAFRRPPSDDERARYQRLFDDATSKWGSTTAITLVLEAILQSPNFLYHVPTLAAPGKGAAGALDPYTVASRLSYFLWHSMPDDELFEAARKGELADADRRRAHAERMLDDGRGHEALRRFHLEWLDVHDLSAHGKDTAKFPQWNATLAAGMVREAEDFAVHVFDQMDGKVSTLLSAPLTVLNVAAVKSIYGTGATGPVLDLDPAERAGLLTQPGFLARHAHASENSWTERGRFVREHLLCQNIPPPPPDIMADGVNDPNRVTNPACAGCHRAMDPIGFGFDQYDPIGRYRPEAADPASAGRGEILDAPTPELEGPFEGAIALADRLANSETVADCVATHWFRYAVRRAETDADECSLTRVRDDFRKSGGNLRALIVAIAASDAMVAAALP